MSLLPENESTISNEFSTSINEPNIKSAAQSEKGSDTTLKELNNTELIDEKRFTPSVESLNQITLQEKNDQVIRENKEDSVIKEFAASNICSTLTNSVHAFTTQDIGTENLNTFENEDSNATVNIEKTILASAHSAEDLNLDKTETEKKFDTNESLEKISEIIENVEHSNPLNETPIENQKSCKQSFSFSNDLNQPGPEEEILLQNEKSINLVRGTEDSVDHTENKTPVTPIENILDVSLPKGESLISEMDQELHLG